MADFFHSVNAALVAAAELWWLMPATFLLIVADGSFPAVPSEALVMALTALDPEVRPSLMLLWVVAALGAVAGDNLAFGVGRGLAPGRFRWWRGPRMTGALESARLQFERRPATVILTGRFVPVGRIAVYLTAGASGFAHRRFFPISVLGGAVWATYMLALGLLAGALVEGNPLLGAVVGVLISLGLGLVADVVMRRRRRAAPGEGRLRSHPERSSRRQPARTLPRWRRAHSCPARHTPRPWRHTARGCRA